MDIFSITSSPNFESFAGGDGTLGEVVKNGKYQNAEIVILGIPNNSQTKATPTSDDIRQEFYQFTDFGVNQRIFDLGNIKTDVDEETRFSIVQQILKDGKRIIVLGGGSDLTFANGRAMAQVFGAEWLAVNVSSHFGKSTFQLLEQKFLKPTYFYEVGYQNHLNLASHYRSLQSQRVNLISLEQLRSQETVDIRLRDMMRELFIHHTTTLNTMFSFDLRAVRASDAPGSTAPSPIGLRAGEFLKLVELAKSLVNTKIIEFTELNPNFDIDRRTAKLVAIGMHRICSG